MKKKDFMGLRFGKLVVIGEVISHLKIILKENNLLYDGGEEYGDDNNG